MDTQINTNYNKVTQDCGQVGSTPLELSGERLSIEMFHR
jgi:hypothetical protein